ncbi:alpha/beta hydrolase [Mycolicibacterium komossense]|uniref:Alpha/beta fold hydrolase n=1 Tax=Mycolicibacterium komossense TaxID=1779 RepID=A0ABT3CJN7_9MYCO|nr:lysophospholipase [Mycolicibacterium komossense]MCV7229675.1 alpha/beta fold hydrolase [Mycolicibacterium komossense]
MPFFDSEHGSFYYRHWAAAQPRAAIIFLHGFGEHSGMYHRLGFTLNAAGIDLWAVDELGHGQSPGSRGDFGSTEVSSQLAEELTKIAEREQPGLPLVLAGHSFGATAAAWRLLDQAGRYRAAVISAAPLSPNPALRDESLELTPESLSADPFYLDAIINDPLAFTDAETGWARLVEELDNAFSRFATDLPGLTTPTLAIHGTDDPVIPIDGVRAWVAKVDNLELTEFPGARHDLLNETVHQQVAARIVDFVSQHIAGG